MKAHFQRMAAYNRWANARLYEAVGKLSPEAFAAPRSGFFPSLLKTLNHILVGDTVWMGRLDGAGSSITSLDQILHTDLAALTAARIAMDNRIVAFVDAVAPARLAEDLVYRTVAGDPMRTQVAPGAGAFLQPPDPPSRPGACDAVLHRRRAAIAGPDLVSARSSGDRGLAVRLHCSLPLLSCHPGLEPGSIVRPLVRLRNGSRLKAGMTMGSGRT